MVKKHIQSVKIRKRKGKDFDEILEDSKPEKMAKLLNQPIDEDLPGLGQFYCVQCVKYFIDDRTLQLHQVTKAHKRRLKQLKETPFTQAEADRAVGLGVDNKQR